MTPITIDFETYWTTDYSLSKMSFIEYIQDPAFECISVSTKVGSAPSVCVFGEDNVRRHLQSFDWSTSACIAHNGNEFDFPLLVWKFDCHPKLFFDTLAMSKARHQSQVGGSLAKLSKHYNLPEKNATILHSTKGKRFVDFTPEELRAMAVYNCGDTDNAYELFKTFRAPVISASTDLREAVKVQQWHKKELLLCDMTARMICYPQLQADVGLLDRTLIAAKLAKDAMLEKLAADLGVLDIDDVQKQLGSSAKFADMLRALGVEPPVKISKTTGKPALALAKTDEEFTALQEHEDERVQTLVVARLGVKSTLLETRLAKMSTCARLMGGRMPVPLGYHSATTGRYGGRVWNPQNLPRINPKNPKLSDALRKSLVAPPGYKVVVSDLSGIELRVNHYLWEVDSTRELYALDPEADLYKAFGATLFSIQPAEVTKDQRQLAKVAQLGLGFGAGWGTFKRVAKLMGGLTLPDDEARRVTSLWREKYNPIVLGWTKCNALIAALHRKVDYSPDPRGLVRADNGRVLLPSGRSLFYPGLTEEVDADTGKKQYYYGEGRTRSKVYGGLMDENIVQAIARDVIEEMSLNILAATGFNPVLKVHDELVYVVPTALAEQHLRTVNAIMRTAPAWLPGIVLWSEGDIAQSYGEAKS